MRTVTKQINIYDYNDLLANKELKKRVLENLCDINIDYNWWNDIFECWADTLAPKGFKNCMLTEFDVYRRTIDVRFDFDLSILIENSKLTLKEKKILNYLYENDLYDIYNSNFDGIDYTRDNHSCIRSLIYKFESELKERIDDINLSILDKLREEYDARTSEEWILETIQINGYEFLEDGTIA